MPGDGASSAWPTELHPTSVSLCSPNGDPWSPDERYPDERYPNSPSHDRRPAAGHAFRLGVDARSLDAAESAGRGDEPTQYSVDPWRQGTPAAPSRRVSGRLWAVGVGVAVAVVVAGVVVTQMITGRLTEPDSMAGVVVSPGSTSRAVLPTSVSLTKGPVRTSVGELLAVEPDFPRTSGYAYEVADLSGGVPPAGEDGRLSQCDRLVWPVKEFPDVVQGRASYSSSTPGAGYYATRIYMRELPAWGREFSATLAGCRSLTITDSRSRFVTTHTPLTLTGATGELHGYRDVTVENPISGGAATTSERHYLLGVVRGVSFAVAAGAGAGNGYPDSLDKALVVLYENQLRRIVDAP